MKGGIPINSSNNWIIVILCLLAAYLLYSFFTNDSVDTNNELQNEENNEESNADGDTKIVWGADAAGEVNDELYQCITDNFGEPKIFGRYLGEVEGVAVPLNQDEIKYLHEQDIKILVIYNLISEATGHNQGVEHAEKAIKLAKELDVPEGVAIFGDIEPDFPVDSAFIEGWYETVADSPYEPALYGVFDKESKLMTAYNDTKEDVQKNTIVWTAYPQKEPTTKEKAPKYEPQGPEEAKVFGWQYGIEAEACEIDTNLFKEEMLDYVW